MDYATLAHWVKISGTVFFFAVFAIVLFYVFWPGNKSKFETAAKRPIDDETLIP